ncbi:MAG: caspase family protein, partial [Methylococcaceae bacterium]
MAHTINFREPGSIRHMINPWLVSLLGLIIAIAGGCASGGKNMTKAESACSVVRETDRKEPPGVLDNADNLLTVDCLLPGQLVQIGMNQQWMTPPRPAIISAWECKVGGGQYAIGYNRDARQKALDVWQQCADEGDKIAQNYLGEIYARSWGDIKPDFSHAAEWFRKAAEQGYSRAQKNLGALYEQGLGVPKDPETALKFYRQAIGQVAPVSLDQNTKGEIQELSKKLDATDQNTKTLQQQLSAAELLLRQKQEELDKLKRPNAPEDNQTQVKALQKELEKAHLDEQKLREQLSDAKQKLEMARGQLGKTKAHAALGVMPKTGQYYALIIGINDYQTPIPQLNTPVNDAKGVDAVLRQKYGFKTTLLVDDTSIKPTRDGILKVLNDMGKKLKEDDSLLIYYAGHGEISSNRGHWLPQDAELNDDKNWISSDDIRKK